jgi:predicted nucleotide-binding protein
VFISLPSDEWLSKSQNELKWGIVEKIEQLRYRSEVFFDPRGSSDIAAGKKWDALHVHQVLRHCVGAAIIGLPRWEARSPGIQHPHLLPTEFCHYEGAVAYSLGLPMLVLAHNELARRVVFSEGYDGLLGKIPSDADKKWLKSKSFKVVFDDWKKKLAKRRDVFLGYCGASEGTAQNLKRFLKTSLKVRVLDWKDPKDFPPGRNILQLIEHASARCSAAIFLFTKDDSLTDDGSVNMAVPRDNVIFEAGYFINSKGKDHVLIIREGGAKMPADLGGDIYVPLEDKSNLKPIEELVHRFIDSL